MPQPPLSCSYLHQPFTTPNGFSFFGVIIARVNYQNQTKYVRIIPGDWENKPGLTAAIIALKPAPWKTGLSAANTLFSCVYFLVRPGTVFACHRPS
jgi:hypothetical protein